MASPAEEMISPISKRQNKRNNKLWLTPPARAGTGFTLLELIFVAAILIFIATLAIPQFRKSFNFLGLQNFVSDVVSFARYAQAKAITEGNTNRLVFDVEAKSLKLESISGEEWKLEKFKPMPDFVSVELTDYEEGIKFYPDGTADKATVTIGIPSGKSYVISTESATGYVKVTEPSQE